MEKWMIVYVLPLEVWMDIFVFPWISRKDFGQIVDRIGNFKFAEHAQFYLHEWGKHVLGELEFNRRNGFYKCLRSAPYVLRLDVPQTPLPENITFCDSIYIYHVDPNIMNFLDLIQPLLTDKEIRLFDSCDNSDNLRTIWAHLAPLLGNIRALQCTDSTLPLVQQQFGEELTAKFEKLKYMHYIDNGVDDEAVVHENVYTIMDWLSQPENEDNVPRMCEARCRQQDRIGFFQQLYLAIRQQFLAATTPSTFGVNLIIGYGAPQFEFAADFHLENGIGEEMRGAWETIYAQGQEEAFQITRHRANLVTYKVQAWIDEVTILTRYRHIEINPIGQFGAAAQIDAPPMDEKEQNDQQQSTSKDA